MANDVIKWNKKDELTLKKAVNRFNSNLKQIERFSKNIMLPAKANFKELKEKILTRNELNRVLQSLRGLNRINAKPFTLEGGQTLTRYEYTELVKQRNIIQNRMQKDIKKLFIPNSRGFARIQMNTAQYDEIESQIEYLNTLEKKTKSEFRTVANLIRSAGTLDWKTKKALQYKQNFLEALEEGAENFEHYDEFLEYLENIKDPIEFFNKTQHSSIVSDLFIWYKDTAKNGVYGGFETIEDAFNYALENDFGFVFE